MTKEDFARGHAAEVRFALRSASFALLSARENGRRTDCLAAAVKALEGALRCVEWENERAFGKPAAVGP